MVVRAHAGTTELEAARRLPKFLEQQEIGARTKRDMRSLLRPLVMSSAREAQKKQGTAVMANERLGVVGVGTAETQASVSRYICTGPRESASGEDVEVICKKEEVKVDNLGGKGKELEE